ncbi:MAG: TOBE domain-containing protein [Candidatus Helarchaeota archaeon]
MEGKVLHRQFIHGFMRYEVDLESQKILVVEVPYKKSLSFDEGDRIAISFRPKHTLVFSHPRPRLKDILEV